MGERKLVEVFRTFFERTVGPHLSQNEEVMREWNHLNKILSAEPIDYSQIEFYLLLANKNTNGTKGSQHSIGSHSKIPNEDPSARFRQSDFNLMRNEHRQIEKKNSFAGTANKKRNLLTSLQSFQKLLLQNQERLEGMSRGGSSGLNTSANGIALRRY